MDAGTRLGAAALAAALASSRQDVRDEGVAVVTGVALAAPLTAAPIAPVRSHGIVATAVLGQGARSWPLRGTAAGQRVTPETVPRPRVPPGPTVAAAVDGGPALVGAVCATPEECASGFCVDGVCCEEACQGQCEACDEPGSPGACVAILGAPRGSRAECAVTDCGTGCDGTRRDACVEYGHIPCFAGRCVDTQRFWSSIGILEDCMPYRCGDGGCLTTCATSDDCGGGFACEVDAGTGRCVAVAHPPAEEGGCTCRLAPRSGGGVSPSTGAAAVAVLGAVAAAVRRRLARR